MKKSTQIWIVLMLGMAFLIGRDFSRRQPTDRGQPMLGTQSARAAGWMAITTNKLLLPKSGTAWYIRLIAADDLRIWDNSALGLSAGTTWANSKVAMSDETTTVGGWTVTIPSTLPSREYYVMPCDQTGGTAVYTDWVESNPMLVIQWSGGAIQSIRSF